MPQRLTATTPATSAAAAIASIALPPSASTRMPASAPSGWPTTRPCLFEINSAPIACLAAAVASAPPVIVRNERRSYRSVMARGRRNGYGFQHGGILIVNAKNRRVDPNEYFRDARRDDLPVRRVVAAIPPGRTHFLFRCFCDVELRLQPVVDRSKAEYVSRNRRCARPVAGIAFPGM